MKKRDSDLRGLTSIGYIRNPIQVENCICDTPDQTVDHPDHYKGNNLEVIDVIESFDLNFRLGNSVKYILRAGKKGSKKTDLEKAIWYLQREMDLENQ